jgi:hypothetical protein
VPRYDIEHLGAKDYPPFTSFETQSVAVCRSIVELPFSSLKNTT